MHSMMKSKDKAKARDQLVRGVEHLLVLFEDRRAGERPPCNQFAFEYLAGWMSCEDPKLSKLLMQLGKFQP